MSAELKPGIYVLTKDVKNPRPDRRSPKDWTKHAEWKEGLVLFVHHHGYTTMTTPDHAEYERIAWHEDEFRALAEHLQPVMNPTDETWLHYTSRDTSWNAWSILESLMRQGKVTREDVTNTIALLVTESFVDEAEGKEEGEKQ